LGGGEGRGEGRCPFEELYLDMGAVQPEEKEIRGKVVD